MTLHRTPSWLCVLVLVIQPATARADSPASPSDAGGAALLSPDELFDSLRLRKLALDIGPSALAALKTNADNHAYVRCSWREGSQSLTNVGIHCKGDTAKHLVGGRPDFTITFDRFARGQTFHGHKRLLLQSSAEDASYLGAVLAFEMFRQAGVPAPRCGFAQVELNGRDLGLYVMIEGENRDFLRCHFGNDDGNLYDEGDTHDVTGKLDKDHGSNANDQSDVDALVAAARVTHPGDRWQRLQQRLDVDRFLAFTALEVLLWNQESYALGACKFRLYHDPATDRLVFFPKGIESVLEKTDGPALPKCKGIVADAVLTTPDGQAGYRKTLAKLLDTVFVPDKVQTRARQIVAVIRPAVVGRNPDAAASFDAAVAQFQKAVAKRAGFVAAQLNSLDSATAPRPGPSKAVPATK